MSAALYLCLHLRDFAAQAMACAQPELRHVDPSKHPSKSGLPGAARPLAILSGTPPLEEVFAVNQQARELGVKRGMGRMQAESFAGVVVRRRDRAQEERAFANVVGRAGQFSPRIQAISPQHANRRRAGDPGATPQEHSSEATLVLDIANSERLLGTPEQIAAAILREVRAAGFEASVAISCNAYAAVLAARGNQDITLIPSGREAQTLAPLPLTVLELDADEAKTLGAWGIRTLGDLAALPARPLAARLGQSGLRLQAQARGDYHHLLVPAEEPADAPLRADIELEQPVELLEPLLFLLNQMLQQVLEKAQQRALAIASIELCLSEQGTIASAPLLPAVGRSGSVDPRVIRPALPERDCLVLLKLIQLELELRPPASAVAALRMVAHPSRPQTAQQGLFAAQAPEPGRMAVLLARLCKLVGEGRAGSPELLDSHSPEAFRMIAFAPQQAKNGLAGDPSFAPDGHEIHLAEVESRQKKVAGAPLKPVVGLSGGVASLHPSPALRMVRPPREVAVELCRGAPVAIADERMRRMVQASSGPWRTSGAWWTHHGWCREEWEVALHPQLPHPSPKAGKRVDVIANEKLQNETLRLAHDPANGGWYVIGVYD